MADNIDEGATVRWTNSTPHMLKNVVIYDMKEKQIPSFCQGHVQSNGSKILSHDLSVEIERKVQFDVGVCITSER